MIVATRCVDVALAVQKDLQRKLDLIAIQQDHTLNLEALGEKVKALLGENMVRPGDHLSSVLQQSVKLA